MNAFQIISGWLQTNIPVALGFLSGVFRAVSGAISDAITWVQERFNSLMVVVRIAVSIISSIVAAFRAAFTGDWYAFGAHLREAWDKLWQAIVTIFTTVKTQLLAIFRGLVNSIMNGLRTGIENAVNSVKELIQRIIDTITETDWLELGKSIIRGIVDGIRNAIGWVTQAAKDVAGAVTNTVKGFLGIKSPSRVFYQIGEQMMSGWRAGIEQMRPQLRLAVAGAGRDVMRQVTTNNYYNLTVNSTRSAEQISADFRLMRI